MSLRTGGLLCVTLMLGATRLAAAPEGGYGPVRLGMSESEATAALATIAKDLTVYPALPYRDRDQVTDRTYVVLTPWQRSVTAKLSPEGKIQVSTAQGRVIAIYIRENFKTTESACVARFNASIKKIEAEFGVVKYTDKTLLGSVSHERSRDFPGWRFSAFQSARPRLEDGVFSKTNDQCSIGYEFSRDESMDLYYGWSSAQ